jgi:micrococcal nuclease
VFRRKVAVQVVDVDAYGRTVGIVFCNRRDINLEMVRAGYAWAYREYLGTAYASRYLDAERDARMRRAGLWAQSNPEPPWDFRRRNQR